MCNLRNDEFIPTLHLLGQLALLSLRVIPGISNPCLHPYGIWHPKFLVLERQLPFCILRVRIPARFSHLNLLVGSSLLKLISINGLCIYEDNLFVMNPSKNCPKSFLFSCFALLFTLTAVCRQSRSLNSPSPFHTETPGTAH